MYPAIEINLHLDRICAAQQPSPDRHRGGVSDPNLRHQPAPFDASCRRGRLRRNGDWYADFVDTSSSPATSTPTYPARTAAPPNAAPAHAALVPPGQRRRHRRIACDQQTRHPTAETITRKRHSGL